MKNWPKSKRLEINETAAKLKRNSIENQSIATWLGHTRTGLTPQEFKVWDGARISPKNLLYMNVTIFNDVRKIGGDGGGIVLQNVLAPGIRSLVRKVVVRKKKP